MRVLVCGSREWDDETIVAVVLDGFDWSGKDGDPETVIIEGGAKGADALAGAWAEYKRLPHERYPADWAKHGKAAGPIRNQQMLDEGKPDVVIAFKDGFVPDPNVIVEVPAWRESNRPPGGTEDMVRRAKAAGIPVYIVSHG